MVVNSKRNDGWKPTRVILKSLFLSKSSLIQGILSAIVGYLYTLSKVQTLVFENFGKYVPIGSFLSALAGLLAIQIIVTHLRKKVVSHLVDEPPYLLLRKGSKLRKLGYLALCSCLIISTFLARYFWVRHYSLSVNRENITVYVDEIGATEKWQNWNFEKRIVAMLEAKLREISTKIVIKRLEVPQGISDGHERLEFACKNGADVVIVGEADEGSIWVSIKNCNEAELSILSVPLETEVTTEQAALKIRQAPLSPLATFNANEAVTTCMISDLLPTRLGYLATISLGLVFLNEEIEGFEFGQRIGIAKSLFVEALNLAEDSTTCSLNYCEALYSASLCDLNLLATADDDQLVRRVLLDDARELLERAVRIRPDYWAALTNLNSVLATLGEHDSALAVINAVLLTNPSDATALFNKGNSLVAKNQLVQAIECYVQACRFQPANSEAWYNLGVARQGVGDFEGSIKALDSSIVQNPLHRLAWHAKGTVLLTIGDFNDALESYNVALTVDRANPATWVGKANSLKNLGRINEAIESFDTALVLDRSSQLTWYNLAVLYGERGSTTKAIACFDTALICNRHDASSWSNRGLLYLSVGDCSASIASYDSGLVYSPGDPILWLNRGVSLGDCGNMKEEFVCYDRALSFKHDLAQAWANRGICFGKLGEYQKALSDFDSALVYDRRNARFWMLRANSQALLGQDREALASCDSALLYNSSESEVWKLKAELSFNNGLKLDALTCLDICLLYDPCNANALGTKARVLMTIDSTRAAIESYRIAINCDHTDSALWHGIGIAFKKTGRFSDAVQALDSAIYYSSCFADAWYIKGACLDILGDTREEQHCYEKALSCDNTLADVWNDLGAVHFEQNRPELARACFDSALVYDPTNNLTRMNLQRLKH